MEDSDRSAAKGHPAFVNAIEDIVRQRVADTIRELGGCGCEACRADACALALNALKPQYVTSLRGAKISEATSMKMSNQTEILVAVTKAVQQVMDHPRHEK